jgi:hypothetical protein
MQQLSTHNGKVRAFLQCKMEVPQGKEGPIPLGNQDCALRCTRKNFSAKSLGTDILRGIHRKVEGPTRSISVRTNRYPGK